LQFEDRDHVRYTRDQLLQLREVLVTMIILVVSVTSISRRQKFGKFF